MQHSFFQNFITKLRGPRYKIDPRITSKEITFIIVTKIFSFIRGLISRLFFKECGKFLFIGSNTKIFCKHRITLGTGVILGDRVNINGLCSDGISIGDFVTIRDDCVVDSGLINNIGEKLQIGDRVGISQKCFLQVSGQLKIGNDVIIGPGSSIFTENHRFTDASKPIREQGVSRHATEIEDGVWVGANSTILPGVKIGKNAIIAANSVVTKNVPSFTVVAGVPAKAINQRNH
jgi:acetyltransferase-like isoleucine patch superfamily enzyme